MMGMMGVFKWLRKDIVQRDRNRRSLTPNINGLNNEAYRNALQAFIDRRRIASDSDTITSPNSPDKERLEFIIKKNYENDKNKRKDNREYEGILGVPHIKAPEIFEIGWVAGTEDRHIELIFAEWQSTRVSLRRHTHPDCRNAIKADLEVLAEIRHPNVLLLMATTHTDDHGLVAIFEPVDCTLFNYVHEQGERVSVQGIAKCAGGLAGALTHAHMRGYVHGAISSHCVYLATSGTVKLGGWELAGSVNSPKITREYEERLRFEVYKWLAPEIYRGQEPTKASDVYGLTLLMWEMCTMNVPWGGLSKPEVERQYVQWKRGVITDLYNFPPLLNNLLDAGLQLDVNKRTLDMSRMRRFLQTLQIQYEGMESIYIEPSHNNSSSAQKSTPVSTPPVHNSPLVPRCTSAPTPNRYTERKSATTEKANCNPRSLNLNLAEDIKPSEPLEIFPLDRNETVTLEKYDQILKGKNVQKVSARNVHKLRSTEKLAPKVRRSAFQEELPIATARAIDSTDDETFADTRSNIKKLKEALASRRENFFYGSDTSPCSSSDKFESAKSQMLTRVRSRNYEPHKPASHKTSLEPKQSKSPGEFNAISSRSAHHQSQKSPYSYVPAVIRDAVVQPKVLNLDTSSFFETSLWKKEKMICISKMRKSDLNNLTYSVPLCAPTISATTYKTDSAESNCTYTVEEPHNSNDAPDNSASTIVESATADITASTISRSKSLQALKDALERATDIVCSTTPHQSESSSNTSSPFKSPRSFDHSASMTEGNEIIFEDLYRLKHDEPDSEIKSIERSTNADDSLLIPLQIKTENTEENADKNDYVLRRRKACRDEKRGVFEGSRLSAVVCESIAESLNENDHSNPETKSGDKSDGPAVLLETTSTETGTGFDFQSCTDVQACHEETKDDATQETDISYSLLIFSDKNARGCDSCNHANALARRRSLPAALGQLRTLNSPSLGKLPIRKVDLPDNTVEDLYIDDEFGDSLNVNMVLLDEDDDDTFLPDLLDLSESREY